MELFDGTIKSTDHRNGPLGSSMAGYGKYNYYCIPQEDSITTTPAPGGREGYAIKVIARPTVSACGSDINDQHVMITKQGVSGFPTVYKDTWMGWSTMLDTSWQPQGTWEHFGFGLSNRGSTIWNSGLYTDIDLASTAIHVLNNVRHSDGRYALSAAEHTKGVWHDWMFHVKWSTTNTGFIELYHKTGTDPYKMTYSIYNVATLNSGNPSNDFEVRLGLYRGYAATSTQIFWTQGVKVGTARIDVEYGGTVECPVPICNITIGAQ